MDEWLLMSVPRIKMKEVVAVIQEYLDGEQGSTGVTALPRPAEEGSLLAPTGGGVGPYFDGLTKTDLRAMLLKPTPAMGKILRYFATHPDRDVDRIDLAKVAYGEEGTHSQLSGALSSFTRRNRGRFGRDVWPFYVSGSNEDTGEWTFKMDPDTAEAIRRILGI